MARSNVDQPSEERLLKAAIESGLAKIQTTLPGIVVSYDELKRTAVVQPSVYEGAEPFEPIEDVPVIFPRGGGFRLVFPLVAGDEVELHFAKADPSRFQVTGEVSAANHVRRCGLYATCVPGASSDPKQLTNVALPGSLSMGTEDGLTDIVLAPNSIKLGSALAAIPVPLSTLVDAFQTAFAIWGAAHTHLLGPSVTPGSPTLPPAVPPPTPVPTGSLKVSLDM